MLNWQDHKVNILMFLATVGTTIWCGSSLFGSLTGGIMFSFSILAIIGVHEFGHYINARSNRIDCTLPYFIPAPFSIGTFGAVIKVKSSIPNRNALMEMGASGPLYGLVPALIILVIGMIFAPVSETPVSPFGSSILFYGLSMVLKGVAPAYLHMTPLLLAGWLGLFVTALNLLPFGQLDGGHVVYAMISKKRNFHKVLKYSWYAYLGWAIIAALSFESIMWLIYAGFIHLSGGWLHPPLDNEMINLTPENRLRGWMCIIAFALVFMPIPL